MSNRIAKLAKQKQGGYKQKNLQIMQLFFYFHRDEFSIFLTLCIYITTLVNSSCGCWFLRMQDNVAFSLRHISVVYMSKSRTYSMYKKHFTNLIDFTIECSNC